MKKFIYLCGVYFIFVSSLFSQGLSLEAYLLKVKSNNPEINAAKKQYEASYNSVSYFYLLKDPIVEYENMYVGNTSEKSIYVKQEVENPLKLKYNYKINEKEYLYLKAKYEKTRNEILTQAKMTYYEYLYFSKQTEIYSRMLLNIELIIESLKSAYVANKINLRDIMKLELKYSELKSEINIIESKKEIAYSSIKKFANEKDFSISPEIDENPVFKVDFLKLLKELEKNPELFSERIKTQKAELGYKLSKAYYYPDFMFAYRKRYENVNSHDIMIGFSLPIFFSKNKLRRNEKEQLFLSSEKDYEGKYAQIKYLLENHFTETKLYYDSFKYYRDIVLTKSKTVLDLSISSYNSGNLDSTDVIYAIDENIKVELKYYEYLFEFYKSKALLDEICGSVL